MTAQVTDKILLNGEEFIVFDCEQGKLLYDCFDKDNHTLLGGFCTNLYRGHHELYRVFNNQLYGYEFGYKSNEKVRIDTDDYRRVGYTGSLVIASKSMLVNDFLEGYLYSKKAFELHFTEGNLDEIIDLRVAIEFREEYERSDFYKINENNRSLNYRYLDSIAHHFLKYKYDPYHTLYWRDPPESGYVKYTDADREKQRKDYEMKFEELTQKIKYKADYIEEGNK